MTQPAASNPDYDNYMALHREMETILQENTSLKAMNEMLEQQITALLEVAAPSPAVAGSHDPDTQSTEGLQFRPNVPPCPRAPVAQSSPAAPSAPPCLCGESPSLFPTPKNPTQHAILQAAANIVALLFQKNDLYGNSAFEPIQIFSKLPVEEGIKIRIDDKLARIRNAKPGDPEDSALDLEGYLLLNRARTILQSAPATLSASPRPQPLRVES